MSEPLQSNRRRRRPGRCRRRGRWISPETTHFMKLNREAEERDKAERKEARQYIRRLTREQEPYMAKYRLFAKVANTSYRQMMSSVETGDVLDYEKIMSIAYIGMNQVLGAWQRGEAP